MCIRDSYVSVQYDISLDKQNTMSISYDYDLSKESQLQFEYHLNDIQQLDLSLIHI